MRARCLKSGTSESTFKIYTVIGPARPIRKLKQMTTKLHLLGESKRKVMQYVNAADAGPNSMRVISVPLATPLSGVIKV